MTARNTVGSASATSAPTSVESGFVDTFTGDRVNPFRSIGTTGNGPRIAQANGQLEVTLPAGTSLGPAGYANAFAIMRCRLTGDFDMQVDYRLLSGLLPMPGIHVGFDERSSRRELHRPAWDVRQRRSRPHGISTHFGAVNDFVQDASLTGDASSARTTTQASPPSPPLASRELRGRSRVSLRTSHGSRGEPQCLRECRAVLERDQDRVRQLQNQQRRRHMPVTGDETVLRQRVAECELVNGFVVDVGDRQSGRGLAPYPVPP